MPPSSPCSGRRRSNTAPSARVSQNATPWRRGRSGFSACTGRSSAIPRAAAAQSARHGHSTQRGARGVHSVAPRSIIACAKSPARCSGTSAGGEGAQPRFGARQLRALGEQPGHDPLDIAVHRRDRPIESDRRDRRRRVVADPGQRAQQCRVVRKASVMRRDDCLRAGVQIAGAGVVAESLPGVQHLVERGGGQRANIGKTRHESVKIGADRRDGRLLQHDLAEPDAVGVGALAGCGAPGQVAAVAVVPGEQRRRVGVVRERRDAFDRIAGMKDGDRERETRRVVAARRQRRAPVRAAPGRRGCLARRGSDRRTRRRRRAGAAQGGMERGRRCRAGRADLARKAGPRRRAETAGSPGIRPRSAAPRIAGHRSHQCFFRARRGDAARSRTGDAASGRVRDSGASQSRPPASPPTGDTAGMLDSRLAEIDDPELRAALAGLGELILRASRQTG